LKYNFVSLQFTFGGVTSVDGTKAASGGALIFNE
jgi:hypothetical protein